VSVDKTKKKLKKYIVSPLTKETDKEKKTISCNKDEFNVKI